MAMTRWSSFVLATISLACLFCTPTGPASFTLAGLFALFFLVCCWTLRGTHERS